MKWFSNGLGRKKLARVATERRKISGGTLHERLEEVERRTGAAAGGPGAASGMVHGVRTVGESGVVAGLQWDPASMVRNPCQFFSQCSKAC